MKVGEIMKFEKSCGAVIFREVKEDIEFLVISHKGDRHWCFPKGHMEKGESEEETALREVLEETGLKVSFIEGFKDSIFYNPKQNISKEVTFFLAKVDNQKVKIQEEEIEDYKWLKYEDALLKITFQNSKGVLTKAFHWLQKRG